MTADDVERDAARYRWLREHGDADGYGAIWMYYDGFHMQQGDALDAAIDAAMKVGSGGSGK